MPNRKDIKEKFITLPDAYNNRIFLFPPVRCIQSLQSQTSLPPFFLFHKRYRERRDNNLSKLYICHEKSNIKKKLNLVHYLYTIVVYICKKK